MPIHQPLRFPERVRLKCSFPRPKKATVPTCVNVLKKQNLISINIATYHTAYLDDCVYEASHTQKQGKWIQDKNVTFQCSSVRG